MKKESTEKLLENLEKELSEWKKVTEKRIEWGNEIVEEVISKIKEYELTGDNNIELIDCPELNLGLRYRGSRNVGFWLYLVSLDTYKSLPPSVSKIDGYSYIGGDFNAEVRYMNAEETLEALKNLPQWTACVTKKIEKLKKDYEEIKEENQNE